MTDDALVGQTLDGRFTLLELVGSGGMGNVYRAKQTTLDRVVAVKVLNPYYASRPNAVRRFIQEARAASRLEHPHVVRVYDFGRSESGQLYIAMELVRGESLKGMLRREGAIGLARAARILAQVCRGLAAAHALGVIHRDLKPDNIMLVPGVAGEVVAKVLDFGIAKVVEEGTDPDESVTRDVLGTPEYMAPEQILGEAVGAQTDLYAVGVNLYEMLTGSRPYSGKSSVQIYLSHLNQPCPDLPDPLPGSGEHPGEVQALLRRLLEKDRAARPRSAGAVAQAFERLVRAEGLGGVFDEEPAEVTGVEFDVGAVVAEVGSGDPTMLDGGDVTRWSRLRGEGGGTAVEVRHPGVPRPALTSMRHQRRDVVIVHAVATLRPSEGEPVDVEDQLSLLRPLAELWASVVRAHGGAFLRAATHSPGVVTAIFGAPRARENDAIAALRCALALRDVRVSLGDRDAQSALALRCGVAGGQVLTAMHVDGIEVVGDVPVRAALLAAEAPPHGVLVADAVVQDTRGLVRVSPVPEGSEAVGRAWVLHGMCSLDETAHPDVEGVQTKTVGRRRERSELRQLALRVADERRARKVVVSGDAGIGKTRLVRELASWLRGAMPAAEVFRARAEPQRADAPYGLIRQVLLGACGICERDGSDEARGKLARALGPLLDGKAEAGARALAAVFGLGSKEQVDDWTQSTDPRELRARALDALVAMFSARAATRLMVLLLEDVHWADEASMEWLEAFLPRLAAHPVLVVATTRPELFDRRPDWRRDGDAQTHLLLAPLRGDDAELLVGELLQRMPSPPAPLIRFILEQSDGNPFYAEELVKTLVGRGIIEKQADEWVSHFDPEASDVIPRSVRALLLARIDALGEHERGVLQAAAVVGRTFWVGAACALFGDAERARVVGALGLLEEAGFVFKRHVTLFEGEEEYQFEHALLREVAYASLLRRVRAECHGAVADWLEAHPHARHVEAQGLVAMHAELAGDAPRAFLGYLHAGEHAARVYANEDAIRLFEKALDVCSRAPAIPRDQAAQVALRLGEVLEVVSKFGAARAAYERALALAGPRAPLVERAELARRRGRALYRMGQLEGALEELGQVQAMVRDVVSPVRLAVAADRGWLFHLRGLEDKAAAELQAALDWDVPAVGDSQDEAVEWARARANVLNTMGTVALYVGRWGEAAERYREAESLYTQVGARHAAAACRLNLGIVLLMRRDLAAARKALTEAEATLGDLGYEHGSANAHVYLATLARLQGRFDEAESSARSALSWAVGAGVPMLAAEAATELASIHASRGEWAAALDAAELAVGHAERTSSAEALGLALGARGRARLGLARVSPGSADLLAGSRADLRRAREAFRGGSRRDEVARIEWTFADALAESAAEPQADIAKRRAEATQLLRTLGLGAEADELEAQLVACPVAG